MSKLTLKTEGDRYVVVTRRFAAPPDAVYRAHLEPELIEKWMLGPEGWTMPVCINEAKPGGKIRYEWSERRGPQLLSHRRVHRARATPPASFMSSACICPTPTPDNHVETTLRRPTAPAR